MDFQLIFPKSGLEKNYMAQIIRSAFSWAFLSDDAIVFFLDQT